MMDKVEIVTAHINMHELRERILATAFTDDIVKIDEKHFSFLHTKQLLKIKNGLSGRTYDRDLDLSEVRQRIKNVLATREHVLNKKESKAIRQAKAKKKT